MARTGRPSKLTQVVRVREDGTEVTTAQQIVERVRLGMDYKGACASAGIDRLTLHRWRIAGAKLRADEAQGRLTEPTADEAEAIDFCNMLDRAENESEATMLAIIHRCAVGGARVTSETVRYDADGAVLDRTVKTETLKPESSAAMAFLKHRYPHRYTTRIEVTGAEGAPLVGEADAARAIADSLRDFQAGALAAEQVAAKAKAPAKD